MYRRCGRRRCPYCGYEAPKTPEKNRPPEGSLAALTPGDRAVITRIDTTDGRLIRKLMAIGLIPGSNVYVLQNNPGMVLRLDRAELAVDRETAAVIKVRVYPCRRTVPLRAGSLTTNP